jgi:uncharacterized membrane protein
MTSPSAERKIFQPERVIAFSDGVMAVAITLLVLDLKLPENVSDTELAAALRGSLHGVTCYALSFVVIGLFWMAHHEQYSYIRRVDPLLLWLNLFFLMTIGLIPFLTSVLSDHDGPLPTVIYANVVVATCLLLAAMWWHASRNPDLIAPNVPQAARRDGLFTPVMIAGVFALSVPIAYLLGPSAAQWSWLLAFPAARLPSWLDKTESDK